MKVLVAVKRVIDANVKVRVKADGTGVETANVKMAMNPFCEIAVEEAIRMKEAGKATEIVAVSCGGTPAQETIRTALAMGADRGIHVQTDVELQPLAVAKLLKAVAAKEQPQIILLGKQAVDDDAAQVGPMVAELLGLPCVTVVAGMELQGQSATIEREIEGGREIVEVQLPAVLAADKGLNEPRYASLKGIMAAKKKPIEEKAVDLGPPNLELVSLSLPAARPTKCSTTSSMSASLSASTKWLFQ